MKILKSPILIGIITLIVNWLIIPRIIHLMYPDAKDFYLFSILLLLFISAIGILYTLKYKRLIRLKYYIKFALILFSPPILIFCLLLKDSHKFQNVDPNNGAAALAVVAVIWFIIVSSKIALCNCITLFLSNVISFYFSKMKRLKNDE